MSIDAFRAYFQLHGKLVCGEPSANGINAFVLNFDSDEAAGIVSVEDSKLNTDNRAGAWYTIDGRNLYAKPKAKGIYINNGKRVIIM